MDSIQEQKIGNKKFHGSTLLALLIIYTYTIMHTHLILIYRFIIIYTQAILLIAGGRVIVRGVEVPFISFLRLAIQGLMYNMQVCRFYIFKVI